MNLDPQIASLMRQTGYAPEPHDEAELDGTSLSLAPAPGAAMSFETAFQLVIARINTDPAMRERFLAGLDRDQLLRDLTKLNLDPFPADPGTVQVSIWDNEFGATRSKVEARYCVSIQAYVRGNVRLNRPDFSANADLLSPKTALRRMKDWGLSDGQKTEFRDIAEQAQDNGLLIGRLRRVKRGRGQHTFPDHYVLATAPTSERFVVMLSTPNHSQGFDNFDTRQSDGHDLPIKDATHRVIRHARWSDEPSLREWAC